MKAIILQDEDEEKQELRIEQFKDGTIILEIRNDEQSVAYVVVDAKELLSSLKHVMAK